MSKDLMIGGGTAIALLGVIVYNQYKFGKLQEQIDELRGECQTMAKYIQLLEARLGPVSKTDGHRHQIQTGNNSEAQITPVQTDGGTQRVNNPNPQLAHHTRPPQNPNRGQPVRATPAQQPRGEPRVVRSKPEVRPPSDDEKEGSESGEESPPVSNRRAPPPSRQPNRRTQPPPRAARSPPEEEEEKQDSERRARAPNRQVPKQNPPSARQNPSSSGKKEPEKEGKDSGSKKRFVGKGDDEEEQPLVSGRRSGPKSILKNGESTARGEQTSKGNNPVEEAKENNADVDADLLGDIEKVAKSSKRDESEGREDTQTSAQARMDRTKAIAAAMQKKREERQVSAVV